MKNYHSLYIEDSHINLFFKRSNLYKLFHLYLEWHTLNWLSIQLYLLSFVARAEYSASYSWIVHSSQMISTRNNILFMAYSHKPLCNALEDCSTLVYEWMNEWPSFPIYIIMWTYREGATWSVMLITRFTWVTPWMKNLYINCISVCLKIWNYW